ncbi:MAG: hypothetical protein D3910_02820 [Candidatus Electrothrix sp. ATG2]|nr:hypothetical protein [Candidatus Electrothrix sp. ATG2]
MKTVCDWTYEHCSELEKIDPQYDRFFRIVSELNGISDGAVLRRLETEVDFKWRDEYSVGVRAIDSQHKKFLRIIKKIFDLQRKGDQYIATASQPGMLFDELLNYTHAHFRSEEALMEQYGYPEMYKQKKEHEVLMAELYRQVYQVRNSNGSTAKMVYFLIQWFVKHTMYSDRDVGLYITRKKKALAFRFNLGMFTQKIDRFFKGELLTAEGGKNA